MRLMKVTEVNSEENLVQVEGVVVPTNIAVESGDVMIMEAGELKEAGGNQLQMVTTGSNSKDSMRSGGKATTENDQGVWTERNHRIFMGVSKSVAVVIHAMRKDLALRISFCFPLFRTWKDITLVNRILFEL
ncbi:hypothetical protein RIF29_20822 [Crotalaria pallida]|uniref:Uncharacterized protein n=1 Tax=Crotalaria pallida TaxID=3830 RepID=A0AAN9I906_CROPI